MSEAAGLRQLASGQSLAAINARHKALLESTRASLEAAATLVQSNEPPELAALELRAALDTLGRIVGTTDTEDILGEIFSSFCIGK
jgi:tRNA modification GTPase